MVWVIYAVYYQINGQRGSSSSKEKLRTTGTRIMSENVLNTAEGFFSENNSFLEV